MGAVPYFPRPRRAGEGCGCPWRRYWADVVGGLRFLSILSCVTSNTRPVCTGPFACGRSPASSSFSAATHARRVSHHNPRASLNRSPCARVRTQALHQRLEPQLAHHLRLHLRQPRRHHRAHRASVAAPVHRVLQRQLLQPPAHPHVVARPPADHQQRRLRALVAQLLQRQRDALLVHLQALRLAGDVQRALAQRPVHLQQMVAAFVVQRQTARRRRAHSHVLHAVEGVLHQRVEVGGDAQTEAARVLAPQRRQLLVRQLRPFLAANSLEVDVAHALARKVLADRLRKAQAGQAGVFAHQLICDRAGARDAGTKRAASAQEEHHLRLLVAHKVGHSSGKGLQLHDAAERMA
eukprot:scaffold4849_cov202-Prasinococcus_capsulatus_cf.AAC.2